jgi:succinyl-CoA synthetase beta subunit
MNIHEYQAKQLFQQYGIPIPIGQLVTADDAANTAQVLGGDSWVVKAQVHAGGRGKAGGVKLAKTANEAAAITKALVGTRLITQQTDAAGLPVQTVLLEKTYPIERELYLSLVLDRGQQRLAFIASASGGMDIETVAEHTPEKIITVHIHPATGLQAYQCRQIAYGLSLTESQGKQLEAILHGMYQLFLDKDASQIEINPLIATDSGDLMALDAKINFDDNALSTHPDIMALKDASQEDSRENQARQFGAVYITLEGNIGCMVNGAGLAMATMDVIKLKGGQPANFLDVGGGTTPEKVTQAFQLILSDPNVKAILINIFGGIVKCDTIAEGILAAVKQTAITLPVVVRLEGTNVELGQQLLNQSGLNLTAANDLDQAAELAVKLAEGV